MRFIIGLTLLTIITCLISCKWEGIPVGSTYPQESTITLATGAILKPTNPCEMVPTTEILDWDTVQLPAEGIGIEESHLVTYDDALKTWPISAKDKLGPHLEKSCKRLETDHGITDCFDKFYLKSWEKVWSGVDQPNNKNIVLGRGALNFKNPKVLPTLDQEMFLMNMYWKIDKMPAFPTKYLMCYQKNCVVVAAGYEQGPPKKDGLFGYAPEVSYFLKAPNQSKVRVGKLKNQSIDFGPLECK